MDGVHGSFRPAAIRLMLPGGLLFVWTNACAAWIAARLGRRLLPGASGATRVLAGLLLFVALTVLCPLALGAVGLLARVPLAVLLAALALAAARLGRDAPGSPAAPDGAAPGRVDRLAWLIAGGVCLSSAASVLSDGVTYGWDTLTYHAVSPAWWIQHGSLALPPFNYQSYYPLAAEVHALWFMLPFGTDAHANLGTLSWIGILAAAFAVHARILGQRPWLAAAALCCVLLSSGISERLPYFTSVDLALATVLLAMLAFAWAPDTGRRATGRALLCGLAGGLAVGLKPTAAPLVALAALFWIWRGRRLDGALRHVGAFLAGALLLGAPWYLRNLWLTGNPFFPAAIGPFDGPFTAEAQRATSLLPALQASWSAPRGIGPLLTRLLDWPLPLGFLSAAGYAVGIWALLRARDGLQRVHISLMLLAGLLFLALFPLAPFSGTTNRPGAPTVTYVRYITFWYLTGLALLPSLLPARTAVAAGGRPPLRTPRALLPLALLLALIVLAAATPARAASAARNLGAPDWSQLGPAWAALESLPDGAHIAVYSRDPPSHSLIYPLFGRRLQFEPVAINLDGTPRRPLHETWREHPPHWWWEFAAIAKLPRPGILLRNLRRSGVEFLLFVDWPRPDAVAAWDPSHPRWSLPKLLNEDRQLFTDEYASLWDIRRPEPPR